MKLRLAKPAREAIGARVRQLRRFHELEQTELAKMAGVSQAIISQYEKGLTEVSLSFINFLGEKFGISGDWLIFGSGISPLGRGNGELKVDFPSDPRSRRSVKGSKAGFMGIPLVDPRTAACPGAIRPGNVKEWDILPKRETAGRRNLIAVDVRADWVKSMNFPFQPPCRVIIDPEDRKIRAGAYYALDTGAHKKSSRDATINAIRRLNLSGNRLWLLSDRPEDSFELIDLKSESQLDRIIVGRIFHAWKKFP